MMIYDSEGFFFLKKKICVARFMMIAIYRNGLGYLEFQMREMENGDEIYGFDLVQILFYNDQTKPRIFLPM